MSYHNTSLGSWFEDEVQKAIEKECPPSSTYNAMIARANELESTWNPTGLYTWQDMADVIDATVKLAGQSSSAAIKFFGGNSLPSAKDKVRAAANRYSNIAKQAVDYTLAWKAARAAGKPVSAPGFKRWVIEDIRSAAELFRTVEINICTTPWWVGAAVGISSAFVDVVNVAKRVVGVVLKVGESAIKAVERTGDIMSFLLRWAPYLALGVGGVLVYKHVKKK